MKSGYDTQPNITFLAGLTDLEIFGDHVDGGYPFRVMLLWSEDFKIVEIEVPVEIMTAWQTLANSSVLIDL